MEDYLLVVRKYNELKNSIILVDFPKSVHKFIRDQILFCDTNISSILASSYHNHLVAKSIELQATIQGVTDGSD